MDLRFQYNKTSLQLLNKQLNTRLRALPTLKNKESALRVEVKHAKMKTRELAIALEQHFSEQQNNLRMWNEFNPSLLTIREVHLNHRKIAGIKISELGEIDFHVREYNLFLSPKWFPQGIEVLKKIIRLVIEKELSEIKEEMLEYARKKTTQKVNLYEKVQIPSFTNAIMKIKRFLEDEENLTKAAQKIVKTRQQLILEEAV